MGTSPILGLPYPESSDPPDGPGDFASLIAALEALFPVGLGGWTAWVPTLAQGASSNIAKTTSYGAYTRVGRLVMCACSLLLTGAGTAAGAVSLSLPVAARPGLGGVGANLPVGQGTIFDTSAGFTYKGLVVVQSGGLLASLVGTGDTSAQFSGQVTFTAALAAGDGIALTALYEHHLTVGRALWLADELRAAGLRVVEEPGWQTSGRDTLDPWVVVVHHDASPPASGNDGALDLIARRSPIAPLANVQVARDGTVHVVASGTSHNAGLGGWQGVRGNHGTLGVEVANRGTWVAPGVMAEPTRPEQYDAIVVVARVLAHHTAVTAADVIGHREWAPERKIDPLYNLDVFRLAVAGEDGPDPAARWLPAGGEDPMYLAVRDDDGMGHGVTAVVAANTGRGQQIDEWGTAQGLIDKGVVEATLRVLTRAEWESLPVATG